MPNYGLLEMTGLIKILSRYIKARSFEELKIPLLVAATNLNAGSVTYFSSGDLINTIVASSSIPVLFKPTIINDQEYVDGGVMDNLPVGPLLRKCELLIGSHVNPIGYIEKFSSMIAIAKRAFYLSVASHLSDKSKKFDLFIDPPELKKFELLDPTKGNEIFEVGYKETKKILKAFLKKKSSYKFLRQGE